LGDQGQPLTWEIIKDKRLRGRLRSVFCEVVSCGRGTSNTFACIAMVKPKRVCHWPRGSLQGPAVEAPFSANIETIAVGTELALLELGIGASGSDSTQDFVENRKPPVRRRRLVLLFAALWRAW
jgi:hypothetical protein